MYSNEEDVNQILNLMKGLQEGSISRNKNFYTFAEIGEFNRFKRAKLFLSLIEDINSTEQIKDSRVWVNDKEELLEVNLYNPVLKYRRRVLMTEKELSMLSTQSSILKTSDEKSDLS